MDWQTPDDIRKAYDEGFVGCPLDAEHFRQTDKLLGELRHPLFGAVAAELTGTGEDKLSLPYKSLWKYDRTIFYREPQTTGDCTSHATRNATDGTRAVEIDIRKEPEEFYKLTATEPIYGAREHGGAGMSPGVAARWVKDYGIVARDRYGDVDLSRYNASYGIGWGRSGVPAEIRDVASEHPVQTISLVNTVEEGRDAVANGYCLCVGSNQGFSSNRDGDGFASPRGSWSHAMAVVGCDFTAGKRHGFLIANSWGDWIDGGHPWWGEIPKGTFMCDADVFRRMLNSYGTWAFSDVDGFPARRLPDYGTGEWL
jgi:hypothetical protein